MIIIIRPSGFPPVPEIGCILYLQKKALLYAILKIYVRLGMLIFCRKIRVNQPAFLSLQGPLLLACNHPNSFLDGILLDILFKQPVWALARGDVFKKPLYIKFLGAVKLLPVYRSSEGTENLFHNYKTFDTCKNIFLQKGIVQIFSEGRCINEWHLRPLKKGTARLALGSWENNIPLQVLPVGINYSSFRRFGKNVFINFGELIRQEQIPAGDTEGKRLLDFNEELNRQLKKSVLEIGRQDLSAQNRLLAIQPSLAAKIILALPAMAGFILHAPLYLPVKSYVWKRCHHNDHFDSVMAAILLFAYPVYILLITLTFFFLFHSGWAWLLFLLFPFTAWSYTLLKGQTDRAEYTAP